MFVSKKVESRKCELCWDREFKLTPAVTMIVEKVFDDDPQKERQPKFVYVCERHFNSIFKMK